MFGNALSGWHLVIVLFIILLLFGAPKLPGLAKSLGQSARILKKEVRNDDEKTGDDADADAADAAKTPAAPAAPAAGSASPAVDHEAEAARARAEADAAKRELEQLKAQAAQRSQQVGE